MARASVGVSSALGFWCRGGAEGPVTVVVSRKVRPGKEAEFEAWLRGVCGEALKFPGHMGVNVLKPSEVGSREYVLIFRFDSYAHLSAWESSEVRAAWLEKAAPLTEGAPRKQVITGMEHWFALPGAPRVSPPPRHTMAVVTWLAIFPLVYVVASAMNEVAAAAPALVRTMLTAAILVMLMTYVVMPLMTRLFARWLFPGRP